MRLARKFGAQSRVVALVALAALATLTPAWAGRPEQGSDASDSVMRRAPAQQERPRFDMPHKRSYDTHHYYAIEIRRSHRDVVSPQQAARALGVELVDRVGELEDHWLVRAEKPLELIRRDSDGSERRRHLEEHEDPVLKRWQRLEHGRRAVQLAPRDLAIAPDELHVAHGVRSLERQELRRRHKRDVIYSPWDTPQYYPQARGPIPDAHPDALPDPFPRPPLVPSGPIAKAQEKFNIVDPIFPEQWHLVNDKIKNYDLNVTGVWSSGLTGKGVNICLIDDGIDYDSPDLKDNFFEKGSYDFNAHTALPKPRLSDDQHGTRCAGEIAAMKNEVCGVGVAYKAHVAGVRILSGPIADVDEAAALNYAYQDNHIYSCSWGPPDDGKSMDAPKGLIAKAILNGIQNGRGGKGSIFVFAGGNGGASDDQCNFDGYTNSIYSMTIAAVDREGLHPYYSEVCAATIASGWSSGSGDHIHTTDVAWNGKNRCTSAHGGTSAAAPLVAGVIALALELRPELTWRDMQHIAVHSAIKINPDDPDWYETQAGRHYNHKFGYGVIDAYQFIEETKRHQLVKPQAWLEGSNVTVAKDETLLSKEGIKSTFTITQDMMSKANLETIEHVTVRVWISHDRRGDVSVALISPHGTRSILARARRYDEATTGFPGWDFMTLKHWDESAVGEWTLEVTDKSSETKKGNFYAWSMTLWGQSIDAAKAGLWTFPEDSIEAHETLAAQPTAANTTGKLTKPTDHLPDDHGSAPGESHHDITQGTTTSPEADTGYITGLKKNSTWLFAASGVVVIFIASMAAFFILRARRRRAVKDAEAYEFVPGEDDDDDDDRMPMNRLEGGKKRSKRTKELYDAFGEGSSDEENGDAVKGGAQTRYQDNPEDSEDARFKLDDDDDEKANGHAPNGDAQEGKLLFDADGSDGGENDRGSSGKKG